MRSLGNIQIAICAAVLCAALGPSVRSSRADQWDRKTVVNFSVPVEIPGQILPPGTYVFKLVNLSDTRHMVQIQNEDQSFTYATLLTVDTWRSRPTNHTRFLFDERSSDQPEALQTWYYPGDTRGLDFIYPTYDYNTQPNYESPGGR
ncbi:MAG: hypothetical protein WCC21_00370 [Candidatus Acidiferrales bacterium]